MPKPATLGSEELLGYGLRRSESLTIAAATSSCRGGTTPETSPGGVSALPSAPLNGASLSTTDVAGYTESGVSAQRLDHHTRAHDCPPRSSPQRDHLDLLASGTQSISERIEHGNDRSTAARSVRALALSTQGTKRATVRESGGRSVAHLTTNAPATGAGAWSMPLPRHSGVMLSPSAIAWSRVSASPACTAAS